MWGALAFLVMSAVVAAAAVVAAGMALAMVMVVVVALDIGVKGQIAGKQGFHRSVCIAGHTAEEPDACCCQGHLGTAADAAADQNICIQGGQNPRQGAVAAAVGIHHSGRDHLAVLNIV